MRKIGVGIVLFVLLISSVVYSWWGLNSRLIRAVEGGDVAGVRYLLDRGASADAKREDWTALMFAAEGGHTEIVEMLLAMGADVNVKTKEGWTALMFATHKGHTEIVRLLREEAKYTGIGLYFYDENVQHFIRTTKKVKKGDNLPLYALRELIKGPSQKNLNPVISENVKIKNFYIQSKTAVVDFDEELLSYGGGNTAEMGIIGGVVLTLTDFKEIKCVQFLIEGKKQEYLPEGIEILKPICRKDVEKLVK